LQIEHFTDKNYLHKHQASKLTPMDITNLLFIFLLSLFLTLVFTYLFKVRGPWGRGWAFLMILFLGMWAAAIWLTPVGPTIYNIYWVPQLFIGLLITLLLAAATPHSGGRTVVHGRSALSAFFWLFIVSLLALIIYGILDHRTSFY
jgi:hypothetical protein